MTEYSKEFNNTENQNYTIVDNSYVPVHEKPNFKYYNTTIYNNEMSIKFFIDSELFDFFYEKYWNLEIDEFAEKYPVKYFDKKLYFIASQYDQIYYNNKFG